MVIDQYFFAMAAIKGINFTHE